MEAGPRGPHQKRIKQAPRRLMGQFVKNQTRNMALGADPRVLGPLQLKIPT